MKKIGIMTMFLVLGMMLVSCQESTTNTTTNTNENNLPLMDASNIEQTASDVKVKMGQMHYVFVKKSDLSYSLEIRTSDGEMAFHNDVPAKLLIKPYSASEFDFVQEEVYEKSYDEIEVTVYGVLAKSEITTEAGSVFEITDQFYTVDEETLNVHREVTVITSNEADEGFASVFSIYSEGEGRAYDEFDFFIPAILYKDNHDMVTGAIAESFRSKEILVKETRTGFPVVMMRDQDSQRFVSLSRYQPSISSGIDESSASNWEVDASLQYGSLGLKRDPNIQIEFVFPAHEMPVSYQIVSSTVNRSHPVDVGFSHSYDLTLFGGNAQDYNTAMMNTWQKVYHLNQPEIYDVDIETVYQVANEDFKTLISKAVVDGEIKYIGLPWVVYIEDGKKGVITFQMGFVGQQTAAAYHMIRYGLMYDDEASYQNGMDVIDFWSNRAFTESGIPKIWYDSWYDDFRKYPTFLRIATDGVEGMLDAYRIVKAQGLDKSEWLAHITSYADFLLDVQNDNGSWNRAYDWDGQVFVNGANGIYGDQNTQASSEKNTAIPIRFLIKMFELTAETKYLDAALEAGDYVYNEFYDEGKYVGGTPDNPNTVDKEAGIYALYAYSALYSATNEQKWLEAAEQAAIFALSWTYIYDFEVANPRDLLAGVITESGHIDGLSIIATGHSGADNFNAYLSYELFKLYVWTGEDFYYHSALFIQNNTKQTMNWDGSLGYKYRSLIAEASNFSDFNFRSAENGVWLPWSSVANIEPIANLEQTFGHADIRDLKAMDLETLRSLLEDYGSGGNEYIIQ